ncbi:MAG: asparagine synthase (glutamine-hydrolyzing) [Caldilineaceae bacterium]
MCGICGVFEYKAHRSVDRQMFGNMLQVIKHRGPDDEGSYVQRDLAIGMRRLSIIDLAGGKQPMTNEDGSIIVVFNGEIYNYVELMAQLRQMGHTLKTASDTEVIAHLYEDYGEACMQQFRGMFGVALWDTRQQKLLLIRDRLGIKPLYYTEVGDRLIFGSEIKSILQHPAVQVEPDLEAIGNYLSLRYVPAPQTMFKNIKSLPPGHYLVCDERGVSVRRYWDVPFPARPNGHHAEEEYAEELERLLYESVRLRLRSDVPFGAFLSGGVDSSTVVALMSQILHEPVKTFSVGFQRTNSGGDELPYARQVAQLFETDHQEIVMGPHDFMDLAEKVIWHLEQPIADQATVATYMLSHLAAKKVKMVLTGEGGDELFAGYARYQGEQYSPWFAHLPGFAKATALAVGSQLPGMRRAKLALYALTQPTEVARLTNWFALFNRDAKAAVMAPALANALNGHNAEAIFGEQLANTAAALPLNRMLYVDTKLWLPDYLLLRGDKLSMAASLEARLPLLDHKLVEFAATVPTDLKLKGSMRKYLLKKVSRKWLPAEVIDRKKEGFPIPIADWFRKEARSFVHDLLSPATIQQRGLFDAQYVSRLLSEHDSGFADHCVLLWGLASVELWYRTFVDARVYA